MGVTSSFYDINSGSVLISTGNFPTYGVGYTTPSAKFMDISSHWAKESIEYVVDRELLAGITETTFSPNSGMTRALLVSKPNCYIVKKTNKFFPWVPRDK